MESLQSFLQGVGSFLRRWNDEDTAVGSMDSSPSPVDGPEGAICESSSPEVAISDRGKTEPWVNCEMDPRANYEYYVTTEEEILEYVNELFAAVDSNEDGRITDTELRTLVMTLWSRLDKVWDLQCSRDMDSRDIGNTVAKETPRGCRQLLNHEAYNPNPNPNLNPFPN